MSEKRLEDGRTRRENREGLAGPEQARIHERMLPEGGPSTTARLFEEREIPGTTEDWRVQDDYCTT